MATDTADVRWAKVSTPIGPISVGATASAVVEVILPGRDSEREFEVRPSGVLFEAVTQLVEYFDGRRTVFDVHVDARGTDFQRQAWAALGTIAHGETISYAEQARRMGRPTATRAVGAANGRNPVPVIVPCHRVIGADGSLTGFAGGLAIKTWLLEHERHVARARGAA